MPDYVQVGFENALSAGLTAAQVLSLGYDAFHTLCGKDKNAVGEPFMWEAVRALVADSIANYIPEMEGEDGTYV